MVIFYEKITFLNGRTVANLIARFYDVQEGAVRVSGVDIRDMDYDAWMKKVSIVFQDNSILKMSVLDNVKIYCPQASREDVMRALQLAQCEDIVERLPQGFDTIIGENGKTLSGGERQRLSIARAFLKDAPVILLDESTASLDPENETKIQKALSRLIENKTVLIIAHKLRTIMDCDKIVVLEEGHVKEIGKHTELIEKKGLYNKLYTLQNESNEWVVGKGKRER